MAIKLVVFDMAGTTVADNNDVARVLQEALTAHGARVTIEDVNSVMGLPKPKAIEQMLRLSGMDEKATNGDEVHETFVKNMLKHYREDAGVAEKAGVRETFQSLRNQGVRVAIDTGFSREIAEVIFERLHWNRDRIFDFSITSDEVLRGRPFPDMVFAAMKQLGIEDAQEVAKVGDTASDMQQGNAAGCRYVIGVTTGAYSHDELLAEPHTHLISQLEEVLPIVCMP